MGRMPHSEMERQRNRAYALRKRHIRSTLRFEDTTEDKEWQK